MQIVISGCLWAVLLDVSWARLSFALLEGNLVKGDNALLRESLGRGYLRPRALNKTLGNGYTQSRSD